MSDTIGSTQTYIPVEGFHVPGCARVGDLCICDPDGSEAQRHLDFLRQLRRRNVLDQAEVWFDRDGVEHRLGDLDLSHKVNILRFLKRRAPRLKFGYELRLATGVQPSGEAATDGFHQMLDQLAEQPTDEWFEQLPLVVELRRQVAAADHVEVREEDLQW